MAQRLTSQDFRDMTEWEVEIEDGKSVLVHKVDPLLLFMAGAIPGEMLGALALLMKLEQDMKTADAGVILRTLNETPAVVELLRLYACCAIKDPVFVMDARPTDPNVCSVQRLDQGQLVKIFRSGPVSKELQPRVGEALASEFRGSESAAADPAPPAGEGVWPETEQLAEADRFERISQ